MSLVTSLLTAIVRADGDALVMHVGDKPYVVTSSGSSIELSTSDLNLEAMSGMVGQLLPPDALRALSEFGAVEHHLTPPKEFRDEFTVVAARGGDDVWIEIRRKRAGLPAIPQSVAVVAPDSVREPAPAPEPEPEPARVVVAAAPNPVAPDAPVQHIAPVAPVQHTAPVVPAQYTAPVAPVALVEPVQHIAPVLAAASASAREESQASAAPSPAQNPGASFGEAGGEASGEQSAPVASASARPEASASQAVAGPDPVAHTPEPAIEPSPVVVATAAARAPAASASAREESQASYPPSPAQNPDASFPPSLAQSLGASIQSSLARNPGASFGEAGGEAGGEQSAPVASASARPEASASQAVAGPDPVAHTPEPAIEPSPVVVATAAARAPAASASASAREESQASYLPSPAQHPDASFPPALAQHPGASFPPALAQHPGASFGEAGGEAGGETRGETSPKRPVLESREGVPVAPVHAPSLSEDSESFDEADVEASRTEPDARIASVASVASVGSVAYVALAVPTASAPAREESQADYLPPSLATNSESVRPSLTKSSESFPPSLAQSPGASFPPSLAQHPGASFGAAGGEAGGDTRGETGGLAGGEISPSRPALESREAGPVVPGVVLPMTRTLRIEVPSRTAAGRHADAERLLSIAAARGASVLYLTSQSRPFLKVEGDIRPIENEPPLASADVEAAVLELMPETAREAHSRGEPAEWVSEFEGIGRIRCTTFRDYRGAGALFHLISARPISAEQLGLAREVQALATESDGLVLVASPRGSGKSTVVSALVDVINRQHSAYVITLERQIRIVHENRHSLITQREVRGTAGDVVALARTALRENPDVLVIEDLMSPDVIQLALDAAGSGLLVFLSVTAGSTTSALVRMIDLFPPDRRKAVQAALAERLRGAFAQVLLWKTGGGRVAARELLLTTPAVAGLIAEGQIAQLAVAMDSGRKVGMVSLNDALMAFVQSGAVDVREAYRKADDRAALLALLKRTGLDTSFAERLA